MRAPADAQHTERGRVVELSDRAPVAMVSFYCGCRAYVPLRRLRLDLAPHAPVCEVDGCTNPRWEGSYCPSHPGGDKGAAITPLRVEPGPKTPGSAERAASSGGRAADETPPAPAAPRTTKASAATGTRAQAAGRRGASSARPASDRTATAPLAPSEPRGSGPCGPEGVGAAQTSAPLRRRRRRALVWTPERIIEAICRWDSEHGSPPRFDDWDHASAEHPNATTVAARFGSWSEAVRWAGFTPRPVGHPKRGTL